MDYSLKRIPKLLGGIIVVLYGSTLVFLFFASVLFTAYLNDDRDEITSFSRVEPIFFFGFIVALLILFGVSLYLAKNTSVNQVISAHLGMIRNSILCTIFISAVVWVLSSQFRPDSDQANILYVPPSFFQGDYDLLEPGAYLDMNPHQLGLIWFNYFLSILFGFHNIVVFQLLNAVALTVIYGVLASYSKVLSLEPIVQVLVLLSGVIFSPAILYCSFYYGTLIGLMFALLGMNEALKFFKRGDFRFAFTAGVFLALAVMTKPNYAIFVVALVLVDTMIAIKTKAVKVLTICVISIALVIMQNQCILSLTRSVSGYELDQGIGSLAYIAMGLEESSRAPGWYSLNSVDTYEEVAYQSEAHDEISIHRIEERLQVFANDPIYAFKFFSKKEISEWCNPTFQSEWNLKVIKSDIVPPKWVNWMIYHDGMNHPPKAFQLFVYLFALIHCFIYRKSLVSHPERMLLAVAFLGGFVCFTFWEAKAQYTMPFFLLLIPYASAGFIGLLNRLSKSRNKYRSWLLVRKLASNKEKD